MLAMLTKNHGKCAVNFLLLVAAVEQKLVLLCSYNSAFLGVRENSNQ